MAAKSRIEWTDATWNIITGCSRVSPGCVNCYAERLAATRLKNHPSREGLTDENGRWNGEVRFNGKWLNQPLDWKQPRRIFVCAHGDLFHEAVPNAWLDAVFAVMGQARQHVFQVLTKRPERAREYLEGLSLHHSYPWPHVWIGTSVEDQPTADKRIASLLYTPAAIRWLSVEPLLAPIVLGMLRWDGITNYDALRGKHGLLLTDNCPALDWVVVGGESGPGARPMEADWVRSLRDQCVGAGVPFFFKQWGGRTAKSGGRLLDGRTWDEMPAREVAVVR